MPVTGPKYALIGLFSGLSRLFSGLILWGAGVIAYFQVALCLRGFGPLCGVSFCEIPLSEQYLMRYAD